MEAEKTDPKYWRIRIKFPGEDLTRDAWERHEVGIWYGAWGAKDWKAARKLEDPEALKWLSVANKTGGLTWSIKANHLHTAERFANIKPQDWVVAYFDNALHLAHVCTDVRSSSNHPLNRAGQVFKFRKIESKKSFSLNRLPDAFRLLSSAGRSNVHQFQRAAELVMLLGNASTEADVTKLLRGKTLEEALELLGPTAWESVSLAYLILKYRFVPTGLDCGKTLSDVDVVGRRSTDGVRILAQCKKDPGPLAMEAAFRKSIADMGKKDKAFYFAFGGCRGPVPSRVEVVDRNTMSRWFKTKVGKDYFTWVFGG